MKRIELFFDLVSPYSFVAFQIFHNYIHPLTSAPIWKGVELKLTPVLLGAIFKGTDNVTPISHEKKRHFLFADIRRTMAFELNFPQFQIAKGFPANSLKAMRLITALQDKYPQKMVPAVYSLYRSIWSGVTDVHSMEECTDVLIKDKVLQREEADLLVKLVDTDVIKKKLIANTQMALKHGAYGAPTFIVPVQDIINSHDNLKAKATQAKSDADLEEILLHFGLSPNPEEAELVKTAGQHHVMFFGSDRIQQLTSVLNLPWHGFSPARKNARL